MTIIPLCLAALCPAQDADDEPVAAQVAPQIAYAVVLDEQPDPRPHIDFVSVDIGPAPTSRAVAPVKAANEFADDGLRIGKVRVFDGGKLLLTNGVSTLEGSSGGGLARWATIGGRQMPGGIGVSAHGTVVELADFGWRSFGATIGFGDRLELSYARINFNTRDIGALLGLGQDFTLNQDIYGAKVRVAGDLVYGQSWFPQIAVGIEHKRNRDGAVVRLLGAADENGTDYTVSATKLLLSRSLLINATLRYTEANQLGLLGFGSAAGEGYQLQFEGSVGYQLSRRAVLGAEYRSKPDNLGLGEDDWMDIFAAYALTDRLTLTAAYVDLGSIATISDQRGGLLSAQVAF